MSDPGELPLNPNEQSRIVSGAVAEEAIDLWAQGADFDDIAQDPRFLEKAGTLLEGSMSNEEYEDAINSEGVQSVLEVLDTLEAKLISSGKTPEEVVTILRGWVLKSVVKRHINLTQGE